MDAEHQSEVKGLNLSVSETDKRARSSHRIHYEAQVEVIRKQLGDLEDIRQVLGLSQRKICQLLMVDPSAWTRWTKKGESAPPHIYRALQWYMILQEKLPGLTPQYFVGKDPEILHQNTLQKIQTEILKREELEIQIQNLAEKNQKLEKMVRQSQWGFAVATLAIVLLTLAVFFR